MGQDRRLSSGSARPGEGTGRDPAAESGIWSLACGEFRRGWRRRGLGNGRLTVGLAVLSSAGMSGGCELGYVWSGSGPVRWGPGLMVSFGWVGDEEVPKPPRLLRGGSTNFSLCHPSYRED